MKDKYSVEFLPDYFYHIYNRGNNGQKIFFKDDNYLYFLDKFDKYLAVYLDVYAFCLLPNHFHFLIRIKEDLPGFRNPEGLRRNPISQSFSNLFNAYSKAINKQENRTGSLFQKNFKRTLIDKQNYLSQVIYYIHRNPIHHNYCENFSDYKWSSYSIILSNKRSKIMRNEVLDIFGGREDFVALHDNTLQDFKDIYILED